MINLNDDSIQKKVLFVSSNIFNVIKNHKIVAVSLLNNINSIIFILALIKLGVKTVFCSTKDKLLEIENFLFSQGVTLFFVSEENQKSHIISSYVIDNFFEKKPKNIINFDKSNLFSSIMKTSGTTNSAKTIELTFAHHIKSAQAISEYFALSSKDCFLLNLPTYHVSGLSIIFRALVSNCSLEISCNYEELKKSLISNNFTHISLVPFLLNKLIEDKIDLSKLKAVFVGGDTISQFLIDKALELKIPLYESYGLTEMASSVLIKNHQNKGDFIVLNHIDYKIVNDELFVKMCFDNDFIATGDLFNINNNKLLFKGRKKNIIISAGVNIYPEEIEYFINSHPEVLLSVVIGAHDDLYGQKLVAFIKWQNHILVNDLKEYLKLKIASFKIPKVFYVWPSDISDYSKIPRNYFYRLI